MAFFVSLLRKALITKWSAGHLGLTSIGFKEDVERDLEGLQTMRNLARNMSFMIKAIADAKAKYGYPLVERDSFTSFPDGK